MRRVAIITGALLLAGLMAGGCATAIRKAKPEDSIARLARDINKVRFAIRTTKALMAQSAGSKHLPGLFMRLSELYVEQAKYHYLIAAEKQKDKSGGIVSVQSRLLKNMAISTYKRLMSLYPKYHEADKALFFMAHEMRELGDYDNMLKTYLDLADRFPRSPFRLEGLLVIGDYYFDRGKLDRAEKYYRLVISSPESKVHAMARYKMAWCKINRADFKAALKLFEGAVEAARRWHSRVRGKARTGKGKIDLRREALVDSVFCYTEVYKPKGALGYYRRHADSKTTYLAALTKLGNRYYVKANWPATAMVYREILSLTGDMEDSLEYAHRLYEALTQGKLYDRGAEDAGAIVEVIRRRYHSHALKPDQRKKLYETFEQYARDTATKLHDLATRKKERAMYNNAVGAYRHYLSYFGAGPSAALMRANLAEALYAAKRYFEAGQQYELAAGAQKGKDQRESIYTSVVSYFDALEQKGELDRLQVIQARAGLRRVGRKFIQLYPADPKIVQVKFNVARTYYDAGELEQAARLFTALARQFPGAREATIAAHLVLDAKRNLEDFEGLIDSGKEFSAMARLGDATFKKELVEIIKGAEQRLLVSATMEAADSDQGGARQLEKIALRFKGTELECRALVNAFVTARSAGDRARVFTVGEKLRAACPQSKELPGVLATLGKYSLNAFQFARGAAYLEAAARGKSGGEAAGMYRAACSISAGLGDRERAEKALNTFLRLGESTQLKAELAVKVARLHVQANDWKAAIGLLQKALTDGASSPPMHYLLGYALFRENNLVEAYSYLGQAVASGKGGGVEDRRAAAAAQFYLGEISFKEFQSIQLPGDLNLLGPTLQQKLVSMTNTRQAYQSVVMIGDPVWSVAALGRLGSADAAGAAAMRSLALPEDLPEEMAKQVKAALEQNAAPLARESTEAVKQCAATASKLKVLSAAAQDCLKGKAPESDPQASYQVAPIKHARPKGAGQLERALARKPTDLGLITRLAQAHLAADNPYMARMVLGKGLEVRETAPLLNLLGVTLARLGEPQTALGIFDGALKRDPNNAFARYNKAYLLQRYGYARAARAEAKKIRGGQTFGEGDPRLIPGARLEGGAK